MLQAARIAGMWAVLPARSRRCYECRQSRRGRAGGMAEIFISYKSERRKAAEHLAAVLAHYGYSVWFDYQLIKGSDFGLQIDRGYARPRRWWCCGAQSRSPRGGSSKRSILHTISAF